MPELPEVETICADLRECIVGVPISSVEVRRDSMVRGDSTSFVRGLVGQTVRSIDRVGKLIICHFDNSDRHLLTHLRMTGQLIYTSGQSVVSGGHSDMSLSEEMPSKYSYVIIYFSDGGVLYFNDMRTFGYMDIVDTDELGRVVGAFGIEPLTSSFVLDTFRQLFVSKSSSVKSILLDQRRIAGIGNIYADEICFAARVRPDRVADSLTDDECEALHKHTEDIIALAVRERGTTFNNYRDTSGRSGNFLSYLKVYGRGGEDCLVCGEALIRTKVVGRGTVYCNRCQK
jgi:formamidopyrimidine-DNA glycosylase